MTIESLLDIGAGHGAGRPNGSAGVKTVVAVDGDYVRPDQLAIPQKPSGPTIWRRRSTSRSRFDLVQSLEVAEHLPADNGRNVRRQSHASRRRHPVLGRRPPPGRRASRQRAAAGILASEIRRAWLCRIRFLLRPRLAGRGEVMPWYRFNSVSLCQWRGPDAAVGSDPRRREWRTSSHSRSAATWPGRCAVRRVRLIPPALIKPIAMAKASIEAAGASEEADRPCRRRPRSPRRLRATGPLRHRRRSDHHWRASDLLRAGGNAARPRRWSRSPSPGSSDSSSAISPTAGSASPATERATTMRRRARASSPSTSSAICSTASGSGYWSSGWLGRRGGRSFPILR